MKGRIEGERVGYVHTIRKKRGLEKRVRIMKGGGREEVQHSERGRG